jgi:translation initiation factor 6 (eIF-6)
MPLSDNLEFFVDFAAQTVGSSTATDEIGGVVLTATGGAVTSALGAVCDAVGKGFQVTAPVALRLNWPITIAWRSKALNPLDAFCGLFGISANNTDADPYMSVAMNTAAGGTSMRMAGNNANVFASLAVPVNLYSLAADFATIVGVFTATGWKAYVDGTEVASDSVSRSNPTYNSGGTSLLHVGNYTGVTRNSNSIFEVAAIWSRALSAGDITALTADFHSALPSGGGDPLVAGVASFVSSGVNGISVEATSPTDGSGSGPSYQWERNSDGGSYADLSGKTSLSCVDATATNPSVLYRYRCKQTRGIETVTTNTVPAQVYSGGSITGGDPGEIDDVVAQDIIDAILAKLPASLEGGYIQAIIKTVDPSVMGPDLTNESIRMEMDTNSTKLANLDATVSSRSPAATALNNTVWTDAKAAFVDVAISSRLSTAGYTAPTAAPSVVAIRQEMDTNSTKLGNLDATISSRSSAATALSNAVWTNAKAAFIDVSISSRATAGGISQAEIDAIAAGVVAEIGDQQSDSPGVATLLTRLTDPRATKLDNLDALVSSRLAASAYAAPIVPPTTGQIATAVESSLSDDFTSIGNAIAVVDSVADAIKLKTDNLPSSPAAVGSNMGSVASVTAPVTAGTVTDKTGYSLGATGLDSLPITLNSSPSNFREVMMWVYFRLFRPGRNKSTGVLTVKNASGTTITSQNTTDTETEQTTGAYI